MVKSSRSSVDPDTRREILDHIKRNGPQVAGDMAEAFGLTAMAVRLHLYALEREGLVAADSIPSGRGRPAKVWRLTPAAEDSFPDAHRDLAVELLGALREALGEKGVAKLLVKRAKAQLKRYKKTINGAKSLQAKLNRLATARSDEGYMAGVERDGKDFLFVENHCPACSAARETAQICASEIEVFRDALGPNVTVERAEHIIGGDRRCAYRVAAR